MYKCSQDVIDLFKNHYRQVIRVTFKGKYENFVIDESEIIQGGLTTDRYSVSGTKIELGSAIAAELTMKLKNYDGKYDDTVFEGAELFLEIGVKKWDAHRWENAVINYIPCGYFIVDTPPRALSTISLSALDRMVLFDKEADMSQFSFPMTVENLVKKICSICGVTCSTDLSKLTNHGYIIAAAPTTASLTYRTLIQWCAFLTATCAFMDYNGELELKWYEQTDFPVTPSERYSSDMYENDITLTGVVYTASDSGVYVAGDTTYSLTYSACDILQDDIENVLSNIYYAIRGFTYRPYEATIKAAPFLYPLDMIKYTDAKGVVHDTIVTHVTYTANNNTTIAGSGETSTSNDYASSSGLTSQQSQAIQDIKNSIEVTISSQELAGLDVSQLVANTMGFNLTIVSSDDGTQVYYIHNGSTLAVSDCIYTLRNGHFAWTAAWNDGNPKWSTTHTAENNSVLQVLKQYKLTGDHIADNSIGKSHLTNEYLNDLGLEIDTARTNALSSAKEYTDGQMDEAKEYVDDEISKAKTYADGHLETAKTYTDDKTSETLTAAKTYTDDQMDDARDYVDTELSERPTKGDMNTAIAEAVKDFMVSSDIQKLARMIFIEGADGIEYAGKLKVVNGKPVFEYDTTEGGKVDGEDS
jgi:vacuolar-type H+-ATPase subunit H